MRVLEAPIVLKLMPGPAPRYRYSTTASSFPRALAVHPGRRWRWSELTKRKAVLP